MIHNSSITRDEAVRQCLPRFSNNILVFKESVIESRIALFTTMGTMAVGANKLFVDSNVLFESFFIIKGSEEVHTKKAARFEAFVSTIIMLTATGIYLSVLCIATYENHTPEFINKSFAAFPGDQLLLSPFVLTQKEGGKTKG